MKWYKVTFSMQAKDEEDLKGLIQMGEVDTDLISIEEEK